MPTSEWNAATSSGIDVIGTRRAITAPMLPPMATPSTTSTQPMPSAGGCAASVVTTAIAMPVMPRKLPWRLDAGLDSPRSDRMNRTPATRYRTAARLAFIGLPLTSFSSGTSPACAASPESRRKCSPMRKPARRSRCRAPRPRRCRPWRRRPRAARRPRSPRRSRWSPTSAACAAPASPTTPRNSRRIRRARKSTAGIRRDRRPERYVPWRRSLCFRLEVRMNDGAVPGQRRGLDQFVVPLHVKRLGRFVDQGLDEGKQVARVKDRGRGSDTGGDVGIADDLDAADIGDFAGLGALDVAAALDRKIDQHRARLHRLHHFGGDQLRRRTARDQCCRDDDVLLLDMLGGEGCLLGLILLRHFLGVAAGGFGLLELLAHDRKESGA